MKKSLLLLPVAAALISCPSGELKELVNEKPAEKVTIDGSKLADKYKNLELTLTYADNFDNYESFLEDWDIGNPGYKKPEIGNMGYDKPEEVEFEGGFKGYKNDRFKQPYWSPKAVSLKDGFLVISTMYDPNVSVYDKNGKKVRDGYGLSGAIHSRRQFPYGLFVTRMMMDKTQNNHWDAWWAESNNPFSREYGNKKLFIPTDDMLSEVGLSGTPSKKVDKYTEGNRAEEKWQGFNGQQVYEYDMYEWVESPAGATSTGAQWQAEHCWDWYGGYPGVEELKNGGTPPSSDQFGTVHDMKTIDGLRKEDGYGALGNASRQPKLPAKDYFILKMLWTPEGFMMWFDDDVRLTRTADTSVKSWLSKAHEKAKLADDAFNPIQIKYSTEIGFWNNDHNSFLNTFAPGGNKPTPLPDNMYADYFAFYALEDKAQWYGGRTDFATTE